MNYQHLEYFLKAAEYQHFTRAAEALHITQPALTKAILGMEEELGVPLFQKQGRNIELTRYGNIFYDYVKVSLDGISQGISAVKKQASIDLNTVEIAALCSINTSFLQKKRAQFHIAHPNCTLNITFKYTSAIINDVLNRSCPLGICGDFLDEPAYSDLEKTLLYTEPVVFVASQNHPLTQKMPVDVSLLKEESFAIYNRSNKGTNQLLFQICDHAGFRPQNLIESYNDYGLIHEVISNQCLAIVSGFFFRQFQSLGFTQLAIASDIPLIHKIHLIRRRNAELSSLEKAFCEILVHEGGFSGAGGYQVCQQP